MHKTIKISRFNASNNHNTSSFLCARASIAIARSSYGNSVCPSVMTRYQSKIRWNIDFRFSPYDSLLSLVFRDKISSCCAKGIPSNEGAKQGHPPLKKHYFTAINSSNVKMVKDRHRHATYCNKHWQRASEKCQHRWPSMTLNPQNNGF